MTLINAFELSEAQQEGFLEAWDEVASYMRVQPGFIDTRLHALVGPADARFQYVNVAHWESPGAFQRAVRSPMFAELIRDFEAEGDYPGLFRVVRQLGPKLDD